MMPVPKSDLEALFEFYNHLAYGAIKYSFTVPATFLGNGVDLLTGGLTKQIPFLDVAPIMTSIPFFKQATRDKENSDLYKRSNFLNKGFGGVLRAISSIAVEIPATVLATVIGAIAALVHLFVANTVGVPLVQVAEYVGKNMFGCGAP